MPAEGLGSGTREITGISQINYFNCACLWYQCLFLSLCQAQHSMIVSMRESRVALGDWELSRLPFQQLLLLYPFYLCFMVLSVSFLFIFYNLPNPTL